MRLIKTDTYIKEYRQLINSLDDYFTSLKKRTQNSNNCKRLMIGLLVLQRES